MRFSYITKDNERIKDFYNFYKQYFPIEERDTLSTMKKLAINSAKISEWDYAIIEITDKENKVGGLIYDWFPEIHTLIIEFIFVAEEYRHRKVAKRLVSRLKNKMPDITIIVETEKNGEARKFWKRLGFFPQHYNYSQPALHKNQECFDGLILMSNKKIKNLKNIIENYYWKYAFLNMSNP